MNVRVIAASNASLEEMVKAGKFRKDLFYRLNVLTIQLTPLRERRSDILPMAEHFLHTYTLGRGLQINGFSEETENLMMKYDFPGNARELRNLVERATILCRTGKIKSVHLNLHPSPSGIPVENKPSEEYDERRKIIKTLEKARWDRRKASKELGIPYSSLHYKIKKLDIS